MKLSPPVEDGPVTSCNCEYWSPLEASLSFQQPNTHSHMPQQILQLALSVNASADN